MISEWEIQWVVRREMVAASRWLQWDVVCCCVLLDDGEDFTHVTGGDAIRTLHQHDHSNGRHITFSKDRIGPHKKGALLEAMVGFNT